MLVLRARGDAGDEVAQRVALEVGVGIERDDDRCLDFVEGAVERSPLALLGLENAPVVEPEACSHLLGALRRSVARVVVGEDDREFALVAQLAQTLERARD